MFSHCWLALQIYKESWGCVDQRSGNPADKPLFLLLQGKSECVYGTKSPTLSSKDGHTISVHLATHKTTEKPQTALGDK